MSAQSRLELPPVPDHLAGELESGGAVAWSQPVEIATYGVADPDPYPLFVDRRVYQGSSGKVYPIPFIDRVDTESTPRTWQAVHLENRWIRLMVLPELGGRIHVGYDKVADYDFFYRNNVIKPALVGLAGPWISGGVEFNWPQHHRPATYLPVSTSIERADDGTVTVWCSDHDPFARMKGMHGVRLHPDRALVELVVRLHNRTSRTQTFLWWANVAARVHDDYQSFFPTDVHYVADHARRAITAFPAADRPYYGVDYPARHDRGEDRLDWYRNIPVPTSYMVTGTQDDFFGGYDHAAHAGFVHVADRHIAPGKKQWTWGNAPFGHAWDRLLTDEDGPYVELMAGVYTDNQPDFAWLEPGETKSFTQTWFPFREIGPVQQATEEGAIALAVAGVRARVGVVVTQERPGARIAITADGETVHDASADLAPGEPWSWEGVLPAGTSASGVQVAVTHAGGVLVQWRPRPDRDPVEPRTAVAPPSPEEISSVDELYLTGVHLAQYRHPTRSPLPYWEEALRRDPSDARSNIALAEDHYRRGRYGSAEAHLRTAMTRLTALNANPRDGEASYLLGLVLTRLGRVGEAVDAFAKAAWDGRWLAPASLEAARLAVRAGDDDRALTLAEAALRAAPDDSRAAILRAVLLARAGRDDDARVQLDALLERDPLEHAARAVRRGPDVLDGVDGRTLIDIALDLADAGDIASAHALLEGAGTTPATPAGEVRPLAHYHRALLFERASDEAAAATARAEAAAAPDRWCFPSGLDDHDALQAAIDADPGDARARALLAMLLFDAGRQEEALEHWEVVVASDDADPRELRNAALAVYAVARDPQRARELYDRAIARRADARLVYERDQLLSRMNVASSDRLQLLEAHRNAVLERDDATAAYAGLLVDAGRLDDALGILRTRAFAPWEGGEGRVLGVWERAHLALADRREDSGDLDGALDAVVAGVVVPANLGEDRHPLADTTVLFDRWADLLERTGRSDEAIAVRGRIQTSTEVTPLRADGSIDYFATSLPDLLLFPPL